MSTIILNANSVYDTTIIPNIFIDHYMPSANGSYVKVYLYLLRCMHSSMDTSVTISAIADRLDDTEKDIIRALCYWEKVNLISLLRNANDEIISITINNIYELNTINRNSNIEEYSSLEEIAPTTASNNLNTSSKDLTELPYDAIEQNTAKFEKPTYSDAQIKQLTNSDEVKWLLNIIEIYLDRLIKPMDLQLILYLYESLGFSAELIMYLYEYCVSKNKKNPSYIEAVALSWAEEGIDTVEKAEAATAVYNSNYNAVNKAFGLNRSPGQVEKQYINKWLSKFGFTIEIIVEACNRTILATQKPDFKYADKILDNWFKKGVKDLNHIKQLDEEHQRISANRANNTKSTTTKNQTPTNNRFNAFPQRTYTDDDYSSMEQRLLHKK